MGLIGKPQFAIRIREMAVGHNGYTLPFALAFNLEEDPFLHTGLPVKFERDEAFYMPITRTGRGKNHYNVNVDGLPYSWLTESEPFFSMYRLFPGTRTEDIVRLPRGEYIRRVIQEKVVASAESSGLMQLERRLAEAIEREDYEKAAQLRDLINAAKRTKS